MKHRRVSRRVAIGLVVPAIALALLHPVRAQHDSASRFAAIQDVARRELQETRTPGAALALVEGDTVVFTAGVGVADVEAGSLVRPDMLFRLGSTTKMFTATALVTLAEEGRLSLDAPIGSTVPGLDPSIARLTPNQLLSHTAGLRDEAPMFGRQDDDALGAGIRAMKARAFFTEPAAVYSYANPGYWIAGFVVEHVSGKPYADAMQERLFAPLGMARSTFRPMMAMTFPLAQGHDVREEPASPELRAQRAPSGGGPAVIRPAANNVATWPAGSLFSNVADLARFIIAFMNDGEIDGRLALKPAVIEKLSTPHAAIPGGSASYGYGLELSERSGIRLVSHGGSRAGYGSTIVMAPGRRAGVVVLANRTGSGLPKTARRAMEMLLQLPERALDVPPQPTAAVAPDALAAWVGRYSQGPSNTIEIAIKDGALVVRDGGREQPAAPQGTLRLSVGRGDAPSTWVLIPDRDGKPAYVFRGGRAFRKIS